jgi:multisubunit Na+/H+ antiporter MnhE subunit
MKTLVALIILIAPWLIFAWIASLTKQPSTVGLVVTLAVSALGLTLLISRSKK